VTRVVLVYQPVDGGVGRHVADLAAGLSERDGYEVVLCGPARPAGAPSSCDWRELDLGRAVDPPADLLALARVVRLIAELRPDVVHAHSSKAGAVARCARLVRPRTPVLYTPHGYAFAGYFSRKSERGVYREIERGLATLTTRVVCVCEAEARLARKIGPADRVRVVHNGIELVPDGAVDGRIAELARQGPVLCALTQLRPGKGLETLIQSLPDVLDRHPRLQVAIGGEGPDRERLHAAARAAGVAAAVHFLGPTADPASILRGADVFVHPSWAEAFPYVVLEAMSMGLPVLASDVGGISEALVDGESGLLVPSGDDRALRDALLHMLGDTAVRSRMGAAAKRRVQARFTRTAMIDRLVAVYDEVLSRRRRRAAMPRGPYVH
jgi:glycosyltransferase involved in cell wall biosynthesis